MSEKRVHSSLVAIEACDVRVFKRQRLNREFALDQSQLPSPASSPAPLTIANLRAYEMSLSRSQSPKKRKSRSPEKAADNRSVLEAHNILIQQKKTLPPDISSLVERLRSTGTLQDISAEIKEISRISPIAATANERDGKRLLDRRLFYQEAIQGGRPGLAITEDQNMAERMLPPAVSKIPRGSLKTPQVDTVVGYVKNEMLTIYNNMAEQQQLETYLPLFTTEESEAAALTKIVEAVHSPWFSCQWKAGKNGGTHQAAEEQGARDGSAILNYNHKLLAEASFARDAPISPAPGVEPASTVHFSSTIDLQTVNMYVHWIDFGDMGAEAKYRMERVFTKDLQDPQGLKELRQFMDNLYEWAMGPRLSMFKRALSLRYRQLADHPESAMTEPDDDDASSFRGTSIASTSDRLISHRLRGFTSVSEVEGVELEERPVKRR